MRWNDLIGRQLGQYTLLEEIGRGGSSRVYRAQDQETERDVAVKVIPNDAEDRVGFVRRFEREVQAVAQLNHPNIVTVFDRGETDDLVYLVMQCVMGGTLRARLGKPLPAHEAVRYIVQMAQALHHAHQKGIVHRDVKPSNMLIDAENPQHLLLTDFGIAKLQGARGLTKTGTTIGTPEYMAPEQAEGKDIDARADVYSLGCVLYEALAGRPPFVGSSPVSVLYQQVHSRPAYIRGFNPDVPRVLTRILDMTLAKRPEDRYGTAEQLAQALAPFAEEGASGAPSESYFSTMGSGALGAEPPGPATVPAPQWPPATPSEEAAIPRLAETAGPALQPPGNWHGLGAEGLDALFPDDAEGGAGRGAGSGPSLREDRLHHTIPLPAFRLPARRTRPLDLPLTSNGELDLERLMTQVDSPVLGNGRSKPSLGGWSPSGPVDRSPGYDGVPNVTGAQGNSGALREALLHTSEQRAQRAIWRPKTDEMAAVQTAARSRWRATRGIGRPQIWAALGLAAVLLLSAATWVGVSTSGLGLTLHGQPATVKATATATAAPTATATATATPAPTATATTNPQAVLDQQAAAAFRAVTLATFTDGGCSSGNSTSHFAVGQTIYVNLCTATNAPSAPMTMQIRQAGTVLYTMTRNTYLAPGSSYWYSHSGLAAGTYDVRITLQLSGGTATARDMTFTVG